MTEAGNKAAEQQKQAMGLLGSFPENEGNFRRLSDDYDSSLGVVPFIGAGLSIPLGFPGWRTFLLAQARRVALQQNVSELLDVGKYEEAAEVLLGQLQEQAFNDAVEDSFGDHVLGQHEPAGPLALIPRLATGPVITTNFDHALERTFEASGRPFERVVWGARADLLGKALRQNGRLLLKLHGDVDDRIDRILTLREYNRHYRKTRPLFMLLKEIFSTRPVLFVGCSLSSDRIVTVLTSIARESALAAHYAIVEAPPSEERLRDRAKFLSEHRIRPLWYPHGRHDLIATLLGQLLQQRSPESEPTSAPSDSQPSAESLPPEISSRLVDFTRGKPRDLPTERQALVHSFTARGHSGKVALSFYEEDVPAELSVEVGKQGSTVSGLLECFSTAVSIGLQYGVPFDTFVDEFSEGPDASLPRSDDDPETVISHVFQWIRSRLIRPNEIPERGARPKSKFLQLMPDECASLSHMFTIAGHSGTITVLLYPEGNPGAIHVRLEKGSTTVAGLMDCWCTAMSICLQHGVPLQVLCDAFAHTRFEPSGWTGSEDVGYAKSFPDYIARWLQLRFLSAPYLTLFPGMSTDAEETLSPGSPESAGNEKT